MTLALIFSLVFFAAFAVFFISGLHILTTNMRSSLNRVYFAISIALSVWAFAFSTGNIANSYEAAFFWRRFASFGWGALYCLTLHYILLLTGHTAILKKRWFPVLLYFPAVVSIFVFGISGDLASKQYILFSAAGGWINIKPSNFWDWFFTAHYVGYAIAEFWLLLRWGRRSDNPARKRQSHVFIAAFAIALFLGTITDRILNKYVTDGMPQLGPVVALIALGVIFRYNSRFSQAGRNEKNQIPEPGRILSEVGLGKIYQVILLAFVLGSMLSFVSRYFFLKGSLSSVLPYSIALVAIGLVVSCIQWLPVKAGSRDNLLILLLAASIPVVSLGFSGAGITAWAAPFVFILLSVVFNKRRMFLWMLLSIVITQVWNWYTVPFAQVQIDAGDYVGRLGFFIIGLWLAKYINQIYVRRLEENEEQIQFQKLISQISADFVKATEENLDDTIHTMLQLSGEYFKVDRSLLISMSQSMKTYEWCTEGLEPSLGPGHSVQFDSMEWWKKQLQKSDVIQIPDVDDMPPDASAEKAEVKSFGVQALLSVPVIVKNRIAGFILFTSLKKKKRWSEDLQGALKIMANLVSDALSKVEAEKEISFMAYYDALTGLPNRTLFKNRLQQAIRLSERTGKWIGVVLLDLDSFKTVNDSMGHDCGDELLKQAANRLSGCLRKQDTVARFGGDEFLIILNQIDREEDICTIADKIVKSLEKPLYVGDQEFFITSSAGVAIYPVDGEDADVLIKHADVAMYTSKDRGKNQYTLCSPEIKEDVQGRLKLTNSLYRALERNEMELYYQPQVSVETGKISGVEALVRWNHPELGVVFPETFIPLAEKNGLIRPIGLWVLRKACRQNRMWQNMGLEPLRMAVNISVEQVRDPGFVRHVEHTLAESGLEARCLELEITEGIAVKEEGSIMKVLMELKQLGVSIAIDDFGTEYSSLNRLKTLPVDRIKIDMHFIHNIFEGNKDETIAKAIIQLAKNLKLKVIAEGVETEAQCRFFSENRCDEIQGFYFYRTMTATSLEDILLAQ